MTTTGSCTRWQICINPFCPDTIDLRRDSFVLLTSIDEYAHTRCYDAAVRWFHGDERAAEAYFARQLAKEQEA
jgi:predicted aldo/keto reductase-like oxidoreductase